MPRSFEGPGRRHGGLWTCGNLRHGLRSDRAGENICNDDEASMDGKSGIIAWHDGFGCPLRGISRHMYGFILVRRT